MVPDKSHSALVLLDVINDLEWPGGEQMLRHALPMAQRIAALARRARAAGVPVIYVNDNYGRWRSDFQSLVDHCLGKNVRGHRIARLLEPQKEDYFVLKPKHSGFFSTSLDVLLGYLEVKVLVLAGIAGNICVLFTANDAYLRDYHLFVPEDCTASNHARDNRHALMQMRSLLKADTRPSARIDFKKLKAVRDPKRKSARSGSSKPFAKRGA